MTRRLLVAAVSLLVAFAGTATAWAKGELRREVPAWWVKAAKCVHRYEGAWNSNTGNGFYGGMQMDLQFQRTHGGWMLRHYGTADRWSPQAQLVIAHRGWLARERHLRGSGWGAWPNTSRMCGLR